MLGVARQEICEIPVTSDGQMVLAREMCLARELSALGPQGEDVKIPPGFAASSGGVCEAFESMCAR